MNNNQQKFPHMFAKTYFWTLTLTSTKFRLPCDVMIDGSKRQEPNEICSGYEDEQQVQQRSSPESPAAKRDWRHFNLRFMFISRPQFREGSCSQYQVWPQGGAAAVSTEYDHEMVLLYILLVNGKLIIKVDFNCPKY